MFATSWNGVSMMREGTKEHDRKVEIWSDASGSWGCGGLWGVRWFQVAWSAWPDFAEASIAAKELLPIIVAVAIWGPWWKGNVVMCHCDNQSVVDVVRGGYGRDSRLALMLRCLFFLEAKFDCSLYAMHVPGIQNEAADSISRNNLNKFFHLNPQAQPQPSQILADLVGRLVTGSPWTEHTWKVWLETLSQNP